MRNLVILVPSRNRPESIAELIKSLDETETESDLIVVIDSDEPQIEAYLELGCDVLMVEKNGKGMAKPLNFAANHFRDKYRHFAFLGDDHRPRTKNWDTIFINALDELGIGLVYGNDLLQGENLATAVAMSGEIVKELGGMVPQDMIHLYLDNFWMTLGKDLNALRYIPEVVLEHLHPVAGKAEWDDQYREVNAPEVYSADKQALDEYLASHTYRHLLQTLRDQA
jgi:glycosyltransferase involved in cell wall biosynthesis